MVGNIIIDDEGEFTDYDPSDEYVPVEPELDESGCIVVYPDETDEYEFVSVTSKDIERIPHKETHDETVVQLVRKNPDTHIDFEISLDEFDLTASEAKATYQEIKDYVLEKHGLKVSTLYISQVKAKCGIIERECYNKGEGKSRVPQCPKEKENAIMDALKRFKMI